MKKRDFDAVIFDMDGVIFDSERLVQECWREVADKYHMENIDEACIACLGLNREAAKDVFLERYGQDLPYFERKDEMSQLFFDRYLGHPMPMKEGVVSLLKRLKAEGVPTALASSTRRHVVMQELGDADLIQYFDQIICGDMVTKSKPDPQIFLTACRALGMDPARCYGIEDSFNGCRSVHAAGMHLMMVPDLVQPTGEIRSLCEVVMPSLIEAEHYFFD